jgi:hypothetical protein
LGWTVLRFTKAHLVPDRIPFAMAKIRNALAAADPASRVHP